MVAYNFQKQFAPLVERGEKTQTIRALRKTRHARVGERVQLYTGMRTKACRKLVEPDPVCVAVERVVIDQFVVLVDGRALSKRAANDFAKADGFLDFPAMRDWFKRTHELPFEGVLIKWKVSSDGGQNTY